MQKKINKWLFVMGCLTLTVLLLCGCDRTGDLEITMQEEISKTEFSKAEEADAAKEQVQDKSEDLIYVQVTGAVRSPGVYELPEGSRVFEAVQKAGGMTDDAAPDSVNQAAEISDGDMIVLYTKEEWDAGKESGNVADDVRVSDADGRVNINTATLEELCTISGIGEARAQSIITYREQNGAFGSIEEIKNVSGIKDGLFQKIKEKIKV